MKRYKEYEKQYHESQKRTIAAMKIQYFYRSVRKAREMIKKKSRINEVMKVEKKMKYYFTDYVIRFKYLKPRLMNLIKQLERLLKDKKKNLIL